MTDEEILARLAPGMPSGNIDYTQILPAVRQLIADDRRVVVRYLRDLAERYKASTHSSTLLQASTLFDAARDVEDGVDRTSSVQRTF